MIQASTGGIIDFSKADLLDRRWHIRVKMLIDDLQRRQELRFTELWYMRSLAFIQSSKFPADVVTQHVKLSRDLLDRCFSMIMNYLPSERGDDVGNARGSWAAVWGNPSDPDVGRRVDEVASALRSVRAAEDA